MSEKPLCGHCYNECTDGCCDKRRIDVLERQLKASEADCEELKKMQAHLKWKDETRKAYEFNLYLLSEKERKLEEARKKNEELLIKLKVHKNEALSLAENVKFRELKEKGE